MNWYSERNETIYRAWLKEGATLEELAARFWLEKTDTVRNIIRRVKAEHERAAQQR